MGHRPKAGVSSRPGRRSPGFQVPQGAARGSASLRFGSEAPGGPHGQSAAAGEEAEEVDGAGGEGGGRLEEQHHRFLEDGSTGGNWGDWGGMGVLNKGSPKKK